MQEFPATESFYWDTTTLGLHPLGSTTTLPLTIIKMEWENRDWDKILKLTFAENIKYDGGVFNTMYFLRFAEDANGQNSLNAEAFFYFVGKLNQPIQIPIPRTCLDEKGFIYWVLSDEVIEEIKAEKNKWSSLGYNGIADYYQENKELVDRRIRKGQNWTDIHQDFAKIWYVDKTYQQLWEEENLTYQDAQDLISVGFKPDDYWKVKVWKNHNFTLQQTKTWIKIGLTLDDDEFAIYLRWTNHQPNQALNLEQLKEEFNTWQKNPPTQEYLDCFYPQNQRNTIKKLHISNKNLTGSLDLNDFINLEVLNCFDNQLTSLNITNCQKLKELRCWNNNLTDLTLPASVAEQLTGLYISSNNLSPRDLSLFSHLVNLEGLEIGNDNQDKINQGIYNRFSGSLKPLQSLTKLWSLDINNTDIDSGVEYLPDSLVRFYCSVDKRKEAKVKTIHDLLSNQGKGKGFVAKLQTFKNWTSGNEEIDQFIKKYQLEANNLKESLKWFPYEQFTKIEHIADGGFGKVYKAKWNKKKIALKSLTNSQASTDFLKEVANHKLFSSSRIVNCHGISQDPKTKDYLMITDYIKDGDLRKFLQSNQLNFKERLDQLWRIADGLKQIHKQGLTHRDFHSGNILNDKRTKGANDDIHCYITDLGLCRPVNVSNNGKVYGVLPYVAPEVLNGKAYTQAADIYSWGIVAAETLSGLPPYHEYAHDGFLALWICQGVRPNLNNIQAPQLLKDLIKQCWNADPKKRPTANGLVKTLNEWRKEIKDEKDNEFTKQAQAAEELNKTSTKKPLDYKLHPSAIYTSRLLDYKNLPQPQNSQLINDQFYNSKNILQSKTSALNSQLIKVKELAKEINTIEEQKTSWENLAKTEQKKRNDLKTALKLAFETSEELEQIIATHQLLISEEMKELLKSKIIEVKKLKTRVNELEAKDGFAYQALKEKKAQLEELKNAIISNKHLEEDELDDILEAQEDFFKNNNSKRLERTKKRMEKIVSEEEINSLCQHQAEITQLEMQLEEETKQGGKQLTQIINNFNYGSITSNQGDVLFGNQIGDSNDFSYNNAKTDQELTTRTKRQLSISSQTTNAQKKTKISKIIETQTYQAEPMAIDNDWQNTLPSFSPQFIQLWQNHHFTPEQARDWISINPLSQQNQASQEPAFYAWFRDTKNLTPEQVLNHSDLNALRQEYQATLQQAQVLHKPN